MGTDAGLSGYYDGVFHHVKWTARPREHARVSLLHHWYYRVGVGTHGAGLYRIEAGHLSTFDRHGGLAGDTVTALEEDHRGRIWVGTNNGVDRIENGTISSMNALLPTHSPSGVNLIHATPCWQRVAGDRGAGAVCSSDGHSTRHFGVAEGLPSDWVIALHEGRSWLHRLLAPPPWTGIVAPRQTDFAGQAAQIPCMRLSCKCSKTLHTDYG